MKTMWMEPAGIAGFLSCGTSKTNELPSTVRFMMRKVTSSALMVSFIRDSTPSAERR